VFLTKWLHGALRQLATAQKRLASKIREKSRGSVQHELVSDIQRTAHAVWGEESGDPGSAPPEVEFSESGRRKSAKDKDVYVFPRSSILTERPVRSTAKERTRASVLEEKLKAITQVLASFGLLDVLTRERQERLLKAIYQILDTDTE